MSLLVARLAAAAEAQPAPEHVVIEVLSNRADLVSGGDALVTSDIPEGADPSALVVDTTAAT